MCFTLENNFSFPKWSYQFILPLATDKNVSCSASSPALSVTSPFYFSYSGWGGGEGNLVVFPCVFNLDFPDELWRTGFWTQVYLILSPILSTIPLCKITVWCIPPFKMTSLLSIDHHRHPPGGFLQRRNVLRGTRAGESPLSGHEAWWERAGFQSWHPQHGAHSEKNSLWFRVCLWLAHGQLLTVVNKAQRSPRQERCSSLHYENRLLIGELGADA